jgi:hypothetical protein
MAQGFGEFEKLPGNRQLILILEIFMLPTSVILIIVGCLPARRQVSLPPERTVRYGRALIRSVILLNIVNRQS